jgi:hypothetical protein
MGVSPCGGGEKNARTWEKHRKTGIYSRRPAVFLSPAAYFAGQSFEQMGSPVSGHSMMQDFSAEANQ